MENVTKVKQRQKVLDYLNMHGSITEVEARFELGISQIAARIWELKHKDHVMIRSARENGLNKNGERVHYTRYYIVTEEDLT